VAESVTIAGQSYLKRNPLGVLGLSFITLGIYAFYWYYQVNAELRRYTGDDSISPARSLVAVLVGWIVIVPPFIAVYNTAKHVQTEERRLGLQPELEPAITIVIMLLIAIANGVYIQEHLNRIWERASAGGATPAPPAGALPPPPVSAPPASPPS
jgi:hypothetical protein